ncbi:bifunctional diguanylate cyclase/phosphodiesterase [Chromobacterium amazonense]|uniref:EAL domain-containing protein n=1 Tax=Chromobacterium amazonense TaxID=1382803 RepID=A0ABU8V635_9NEIS|nr:EAL domain-containing protein [Chromobacterium amazonense]MDQ4540255.1 EAL domain-containing protein [Chromobacterium amazonense]
MELNQARLSRLQLFGTLAIVFALALTLTSYFLMMSWRDFQSGRQNIEQEAAARARDNLQSYTDHAALLLSALRERTNDTMRHQLQEQVEQAWKLADAIWRREHARQSPAQVQRLIIEALRPLRYFDGRGYFFIDTLDGQCVLLPTEPQREGSSLLQNRDDRGRYIMKSLIESVSNASGRGFSSYRWYLPGGIHMDDKITYARRFPHYNWLIGSGEYISNVETALQQQGLDTLARMRLGQSGGELMIIDNNGLIRLYPSQPSLVGRHYKVLPQAERERALQLIQLGKRGGFVEFNRGGQSGENYLAYARQLPGWDWTLVTSMRVQTIQDDSLRAAQRLKGRLAERIVATLGMTLVAMLCAGFLCWYFVRWVGALVRRYQHDLAQSHLSLKEQARELRLSHFMIDNATDMVALRSERGEVVYCNLALRRRPELVDALFRHPPGPFPLTFETRHGDGEAALHLEITVNQLQYEGERYLCATARDISIRRMTERQLRLAAQVFESSNEAILIADADNRILTVNRAFSAITGYSESEVQGQKPALLFSDRHDPSFFQQMWQTLQQRGQWAGEIWNQRKNGDHFPCWVNISILQDAQGAVSHFIALFSDISERKEQEARVQHMAEYDALTDLPNRVLVNDRLHQAIRQAELQHNQLAVLFVDLDHFKNINDTLGHCAGDELLKQVARRLAESVRGVDTVGRTGGDEFVLILPSINQPSEAALIAERILRTLQQPFQIGAHSLVVGCSIGISLMPDDGSDIQSLLMNADLAMYHAKAHGRNTFRFYTREMNTQVAERLLMENRLRRAMELGQLYLVYQPQYDMAGQRLLGCEALLRWRDPEQGLIMPGRFIPVAEDTGLIVPLGRWVLNEACRQASRWLEDGLGPIRVAVNVSAHQLMRHDFLDDVREALQQHKLPGHCLELEVTESTLMADADLASRQLAVIKAMGVRLSVDDFGTGYSSLAYLKRFAPDTVKIDRSFINDLPSDEENAAIVSAIVHLAGALGMQTLAEGVESEAQQGFLKQLGCEAMQGYLLGSPLAEDAMTQRLAEQQNKQPALAP